MSSGKLVFMSPENYFVSDDDFADSTPPVTKKQKLSNKENKAKKTDTVKKEVKSSRYATVSQY